MQLANPPSERFKFVQLAEVKRMTCAPAVSIHAALLSLRRAKTIPSRISADGTLLKMYCFILFGLRGWRLVNVLILKPHRRLRPFQNQPCNNRQLHLQSRPYRPCAPMNQSLQVESLLCPAWLPPASNGSISFDSLC